MAPGPVDTAMAKAVHTPEIRADYHDAIPLNRYGLEEELAEAIFFLCSDQASYITGQVLRWMAALTRRGSVCRRCGLTCSRSVPRRHLDQFDQDAGRARRVQESDAMATMAGARRLVAQLHALGAQFGQRRVDVLDLEADMEQALATITDPFRGAAGLVLRFQQLQR